MFPTTSQILNNYILQISVSLFALLVSLIFFGWLIKGARRDARGGRSGTRFKLFAAVGLLAWVGAAFVFYPPIIKTFRYRFDPQRIVEIRLTQLENEKLPPVVITDRELIATGFKLLTPAVGYSPDHERLWPEGYTIEIKMEGAADYSPMRLTTHRRTRKFTTGAMTPISIVTVSADPNAEAMNFTCPAFHSWLRKNVDPLFVVKSPEIVP